MAKLCQRSFQCINGDSKVLLRPSRHSYISSWCFFCTLFSLSRFNTHSIETCNSSMAFIRCVYGELFSSITLQAPVPSMIPTLNIEGDALLIDRISPWFRKVIPGDVVIVCSPENPRKLVTKRLIAKEDDSVTFLVDPKNSDKCKTVVVCSHFFKKILWIIFLS